MISGCPWVFPGASLRGPLTNYGRIKRNLDAVAGITGWVFHDFRRSGVTQLAGMGVPPHVADKLLNHVGGTISGVAAIYQKAEFLDERRAALDAWAAHVTQGAMP